MAEAPDRVRLARAQPADAATKRGICRCDARVSATARKTMQEPTSHIRWNTTFHARQAYKVAVEAAQQSATDVAQQSAGATVGAADKAELKSACTGRGGFAWM